MTTTTDRIYIYNVPPFWWLTEEKYIRIPEFLHAHPDDESSIETGELGGWRGVPFTLSE